MEDAGLFRLSRRWHFFAGIAVAPFLVILAATGALYLLAPDIEGMLYPELMRAEALGESASPSAQASAVIREYPDARILTYHHPVAATASAEWRIRTASDEHLDVFVDPVSATVLGALAHDGRLAEILLQLHGSLMAGDIGDYFVELVASWTFALLVMGFVLWWPRRGRGRRLAGAVYPRLRAGPKILIRDLHAVGGAWNAAIIGFLIFSGLPWATLWGGNLQRLGEVAPIAAASPNFGGGPDFGGADPSHDHHSTNGSDPEAPWPLQHFAVTTSPSAEASSPWDLGFDDAFGIARDHGLAAPGLTVSFPRRSDDVLRIGFVPDLAQDQRSLYVDPRTGRILADISFADYSPLAQVVEFGVMVHTGRQFGLVNKWGLVASCMLLILTVVLGLAAWLRRRPAGRFAAPLAARGSFGWPAFVTIGVLALIFPLFGLSILALASFLVLVPRINSHNQNSSDHQ